MPEPRSRKNERHAVATEGEIGPGGRKMVTINGRSIGVFNVNGQIVALLNVCPHELAPVCVGNVSGTTLPSAPGEYIWGREGEIIACPWHGWEFDMLTGECLTDHRKLHRFAVEVDEGMVYVKL